MKTFTSISRRYVSVIGLIAALCGFSCAASAQSYPAKPVRILLGLQPGGPSDLALRAYSERLGIRLQQKVFVEYRPGGEGLVAINALTNSEPDGYTLLATSSGLTLYPALNKAFTLDLSKDLTAVTAYAGGQTLFVVPASSPVRSMEELVSTMKANPGKFNAASTGAVNNIQYALLKAATGTDFVSVSYAGSPPIHQALLSGTVDFSNGVALSWAREMSQAGRIRILAWSSTKRSELFPSVPATGESKLPELRELAKDPLFAGFYLCIIAPAKTPREVTQTLYVGTRDIAKDPELSKRVLNESSYEINQSPPTPDELQAQIVQTAARVVKLAQQMGIKPQ